MKKEDINNLIERIMLESDDMSPSQKKVLYKKISTLKTMSEESKGRSDVADDSADYIDER